MGKRLVYPAQRLLPRRLRHPGHPPRGRLGPSFAFGFYCSSQSCISFLLSVSIVYTNSGSTITQPMLENENLVLFDRNNVPVWQSFEHPTNTLLVGQSLKPGQRLTANSSTTNYNAGSLYLSLCSDGLYSFVESNPPQMYYQYKASGTENITYLNDSMVFNSDSTNSDSISLPLGPTIQYMRFEYDGLLRAYTWIDSSGWISLGNVFSSYRPISDCTYPTVYGAYGICWRGHYSCPANGSTPFFEQVDS
ncbi:hypothetical protein J5N97_026001 [Dioscorea zingiberensis]|uniref:Bulb-type lectin domain-containing protein n=1 Tax=Dioscorea zingiberensis TaxID=325984 RepID=A0A9D5H689_9LILI|nr:hypothetical protein J5N97_026001 [Dioscorea zingiberensis]